MSVSQTVKQALVQARSPRVKKIASLVQAEDVSDVVLKEIDKMLKVIVEEGKADKDNLDWCNTECTENNKELDDKIDEIDSLNKAIDELVKTIDSSISQLQWWRTVTRG